MIYVSSQAVRAAHRTGEFPRYRDPCRAAICQEVRAAIAAGRVGRTVPKYLTLPRPLLPEEMLAWSTGWRRAWVVAVGEEATLVRKLVEPRGLVAA